MASGHLAWHRMLPAALQRMRMTCLSFRAIHILVSDLAQLSSVRVHRTVGTNHCVASTAASVIVFSLNSDTHFAKLAGVRLSRHLWQRSSLRVLVFVWSLVAQLFRVVVIKAAPSGVPLPICVHGCAYVRSFRCACSLGPVSAWALCLFMVSWFCLVLWNFEGCQTRSWPFVLLFLAVMSENSQTL